MSEAMIANWLAQTSLFPLSTLKSACHPNVSAGLYSRLIATQKHFLHLSTGPKSINNRAKATNEDNKSAMRLWHLKGFTATLA